MSSYSRVRPYFLKKLKEEIPNESYSPPKNLSKVLWGIKFKSPIMNAAGMFKNGECYLMVANQGAGAYLAGTGTWNQRVGNEKNGIHLPFLPYPRSHASSNWLGLPNDGDATNYRRVSTIRVNECPVGWSVMGSPDFKGQERLQNLVEGMKRYEHFGVDFLELNESCPNTSNSRPQDDDLANRLKYVQEHFLDKRALNKSTSRMIPAIVKFSNDTPVQQIPFLLDLLFELGYDGVNFGNTSTDYARRRELIHSSERRLYDFFTTSKEFGVGGGISGRPLKESSLELASRAVEYLKQGPPSQEFHVIRTGGIESKQDLEDSERAGISLNQWFTGYFENFARYGHKLYKKVLES